ncbi:MerR family transcriptional regulator [Streptomyces bambusae]|nr:MerR family transcriptional regulator [Streptomyces bambusae]
MSDNGGHVTINEAAALTGTAPRTLRHYHGIGLLPERESYGYDDIVRILWVRRKVEQGVALDDVRAELDRKTDQDDLLAELEGSLAEQDAELRSRIAELHRLRGARGHLGELASQLAETAGRPVELEHRGHPLGAAVAEHEAVTRHVLALHPRLRTEQRRLQAELLELAEAPVDDPRVERLAHAYFVHMQAMEAAERAASFPEPEFVDDSFTVDAAGSELGAPELESYAPVPGHISPAQARCAELLGRLIAKWASDQA